MSTQNQKQTADAQTREIPSDVIAELTEEGASLLFLDVITTPASEVGVARNSARAEILKYMDWCDESGKDVSDYLNYGGGFFQSLFDGNPSCPDKNNKRILEHVRGR